MILRFSLWLALLAGFTAVAQQAPTSSDETRRRIKATLFVPDPLPPLRTETYGQMQPATGVVGERVSYATGYGLRVPAIVYRPAALPRSKMPGLVVNGHGGDKYSWYAYYAGILYAQAGAVVLTYDPIGEGERNAGRKSATRQHDQNVDPPEMGRRMGGLMITDIMQAVSYLSGRRDVDSKRVAVLGFSMGSFVAGITCAIETRVNSCVLVGGGNLDGPSGYWDSSGHKMCQAIPYQSLKFLGDRGAVLYDLAAARGGTFIMNGSADPVVYEGGKSVQFFEDLRQRTIALHGSDRNVFEFAFEQGGGHRPYFLTRVAALWLEKRLDFPNWTPEKIAGMPETPMSAYERDPEAAGQRPATGSRENGTRALGSGAQGAPPAVAHDLLNSLPPDRWARDKDKYIYETWLKEAQRLLR